MTDAKKTTTTANKPAPAQKAGAGTDARDQKIEKLENSMLALQASLDGILKAVSTSARNSPVSITKTLADPAEPSDHTAVFAPDNTLVRPQVADPNSPLFKAKMDRTAFDSELVRIRVEPTYHAEEVTDTRFTVSVNGRPMVFEEGEEYWVPRAYVELMYLARRTDVGCKKFVNSEGNEEYEYPGRTNQRHPVSIIEDRNPKGPAWAADLRRQRH